MSFWWRDPSECRGDSANVSQVRRKDQSEVCISLRLLISNLYLFLQHTLTPSHERAYYRFTISAYYRFTISAVLGQQRNGWFGVRLLHVLEQARAAEDLAAEVAAKKS